SVGLWKVCVNVVAPCPAAAAGRVAMSCRARTAPTTSVPSNAQRLRYFIESLPPALLTRTRVRVYATKCVMVTDGGWWQYHSSLAPRPPPSRLAWPVAIHSRPDGTRSTSHLLASANAPTRNVPTRNAPTRNAPTRNAPTQDSATVSCSVAGTALVALTSRHLTRRRWPTRRHVLGGSGPSRSLR